MTQVFPITDAFDHGSPVYGDLVVGWLNFDTGSPGAACRLHDGYGGGASYLAEAAAADTRGTGFVRREVFPENVRVRAVLRKAAKTGTPLADHLLRHGVYARITGGTIANASGRDVLLDNPTCYGFEIDKGTISGYTLRLVRLDAGVRTILAFISGTVFDGEWTQNHELILWVQTNGDGTVDLRAQLGGMYLSGGTGGGPAIGDYVTGQPGGDGHFGGWTSQTESSKRGQVPLVPPDDFISPVAPGFLGGGGGGQLINTEAITVLTYTDPASSALTGTGRCAFRIDNERLVGSAQTYSRASTFVVEDITDPANPTVSFRDEFQRTALAQSEAIVDAFGTSGKVIADDYSTGRFAENIAAADALRRDSSTEQASVANALALGKGAVFDGGANAILTVGSWPDVFGPGVAAGASFEVTVAIWANVTTNQDAALFSSADGATIDGTEWQFQWFDAGAGTMRLRLVTATGTYASDAIAEATYLGATTCYVMTYKASAVAGTGEGRVRFYTGAAGVVTLLKEVLVPAADRPEFGGTSGGVSIGRELPGLSHLDGTADGLSVWWRELTEAEVGLVGNQAFGQQAEVADLPGLAHGCDFETETSDDFLPFYPAGLSLANPDHLWTAGSGVTAGTGLLPDVDASRLVHLDQRGEPSITDQTRSVDVTLGGALSTVGVLLRATQGSAAHVLGAGAYGYLVELGVGSPAPINLYRVSNGNLTRLASQGSALAVAEDVPFTLAASVVEDSGTRLSASLGGSSVTWTLDGTAGTGVTVAPDGLSVVDGSTSRVASGPTSGFTTAVDTDPTLFNDWALGLQASIDASAQSLSAHLPQEGDGATGDLADVLGAQYELTRRRSTVQRAEMGTVDGRRIRWLLDGYEPRFYALAVAGLSQAEADALRAFYDAHMPRYAGWLWARRVPFSWDPGVQTSTQSEPPGLWVFDGPLTFGRAGVLYTANVVIAEVQSPAESFVAPPVSVPEVPEIESVTAP